MASRAKPRVRRPKGQKRAAGQYVDDPSVELEPAESVIAKTTGCEPGPDKAVNDKPWLWKKGQSGNPHGVPKWYRTMRQLAGDWSPRAIARLVELMEQNRNLMVAKMAADSLLAKAGLSDYAFEKANLEDTRPQLTDEERAARVLAVLARVREIGARPLAPDNPELAATAGTPDESVPKRR